MREQDAGFAARTPRGPLCHASRVSPSCAQRRLSRWSSQQEGLLYLPPGPLAVLAGQLGRKDLGRLACCSSAARGRVHRARLASAVALGLAARHGHLPLLRAQLEASPASADYVRQLRSRDCAVLGCQ